jgi:hypothetical protein
MAKQMTHSSLGECTVLMEVEIDRKHLILVKSLNHRQRDSYGDSWYGLRSYKTKNRLIPLYYALWGNEIGDKMGVTPLYTPSGKPKTQGSATKAFLEMANTAPVLNFKH